MDCANIINIIALIIIPILAVVIANKLQDRDKKRTDKMDIFKTLMTDRIWGWTDASVKALNLIDVVYANDDKVRNQWKTYYKTLCKQNPTDLEIKEREIERDKLLERMAESLGYKDKITWETIQSPYIPQGMIDRLKNQQTYQDGQLELMLKMLNKSGGNNNG